MFFLQGLTGRLKTVEIASVIYVIRKRLHLK